MTTKTYFFSGFCKWAKVREPDEKYDNYQVVLYMDKPSWIAFKDSGIQLKVKEDEDGKYVTFKRKRTDWEGKDQGPPEINIWDPEKNTYVPFPEGLIGNGSIVTLRIDVYDTRNGKGSRMVTVGINKLEEYSGKAPEMPPPSAQLAMPF